MPRVIVSREDSMIYVDGTGLKIDCSDLPTYFSIIQWDGTKGWIEFAEDGRGRRMPNLEIKSIDAYAYLIERHDLRKKELEEQAKKEKEKTDRLAAERKAQAEQLAAEEVENRRKRKRK